MVIYLQTKVHLITSIEEKFNLSIYDKKTQSIQYVECRVKCNEYVLTWALVVLTEDAGESLFLVDVYVKGIVIE